MSLTTKEVIAKLDAIGASLTQDTDPELPLTEHSETRIRRATYLVGQLRGELSAQAERGG